MIFDTTEGPKNKEDTAVVAQGSAFGADLGNVVYDDVLTLFLIMETKLLGFADNLAAVIITGYPIECDQRKFQILEHG